MKSRGVILVFAVISAAALAVIIANRRAPIETANSGPRPQNTSSVEPLNVPATAVPERTAPVTQMNPVQKDVAAVDTPKSITSTNKLERLAQIRETFHALAAGDRIAAIRAAKQITNEVERETALLTLVTEWKHGELESPKRRAHWIDTYGLEAGLGFELAGQPDLAIAWADELTEGPARTDLFQSIGRGMIGSDPAAAFALSGQVQEGDRQKFVESLLGNWASRDTAAALQWAAQLPDAADRDAALQTIRGVAPTGIGAAVVLQDGHPIIKELVPGTPAALSGLLHAGDRVLAIAQGNSVFVDAQNLPLPDVIQMIRGTAGTPVQLQVLPANAPPNSLPQIITIYRDQIKFKN